MMPQNYVPYHVHSMLSNGVTNIDSITDFHEYIDVAKKLGMKAFGFSEHGCTFAWLKKKEYIESCGMKYIHAVEAYLTADDELCGHKTRDNYHIVLIARNYDGVKELNKLVSKSFTRNDFHFYYVPRIGIKELLRTSNNIIVTSACLGGVLPSDDPYCKELFIEFLIRNKDRCFLEIQHHNCEDQIEYNKYLYQLHQDFGIRLIVGTDTHALNDEHMDGRSLLQVAKGVHFENEDDWDLTFKSLDELISAYKKQNALPIDVIYEAINNTNTMADMVEEFQLDYSPKYPKLYDDSDTVFKKKINEGVISRGINKYPNYKSDYLPRIRYEYDVYKKNGAIDFMLLEENYKSAMRKQGIKYGYSRGSVSGSIIAYLLYITEIDSVKYNLNFERFMNTERVSLADVDTDWYSEDRKYVKDYLYSKPGLYCCDIVTFNTIALKGAIDDVCRGLNRRGGEFNADEIKNLCETNEELARKKYPKVFKYVDMVNGCVVSVGNHPAGCVISPVPVDEWFGTFTTSTNVYELTSDGKPSHYPISVLNMKEIDSLNFVKLDILGLDNIGLIYKTCEAANIPFATPDNIPSNDINVWNSIKEDTTMIFQWESQTATKYLQKLMSDKTIQRIKEQNPNFSYMDLLSMGNGAIRPAGESYRDQLADGIYKDNGNKELNEFLAPTLGFLVFQEEIIEFLHSFCGFTMGEADVVRRCVDENTMITMANGKRKKIKDIVVGDEVITLDNEGQFKYNVVNKIFDNGYQDVIEIETLHKISIRVTKSHLMYTQRGWIRASDLTFDDCLITPKIINSKINKTVRPNQRLSCSNMFLIGMMIGDGHTSKWDYHFTNSDLSLIEKFKDCVNNASRSKYPCEFNIYEQDGITVDKIYSISIKTETYKNAIKNLFREYDLEHLSVDKYIPSQLMEYPIDEKLLSLLGGLFSTDGGYIKKTNAIDYSSISKELVYDIKYLLLKAGIYSYVLKKYVKGYDYYCYSVLISQRDSLQRFKDVINPYVVGEKQEIFNEIITSNNNCESYNYILPHECTDEIKNMCDVFNISYNSMGESIREYNMTDIKAKRILNKVYCPKTYELIMSNYIPLKISSIKECGKSHVYDIEVESNHNYIANQLVVHNCFAKKTGTEPMIPIIKNGGEINKEHHIDGFIYTMNKKYGTSKDEAEKIIVDFLQVIEDASSYLFSKNHSDPYSWIGYICGYLRYYYPLEFITSALNIFADKEDKSIAITNYAKRNGIKIQPIKFRHSIAEYSFNKENNEIFKGIASIKYMNVTVANEIYELRENQYDTFVDLLFDLKEKTTLNSKQLNILINLDFFEEFGDANYLLKLTDLAYNFSLDKNKKLQIRKDKLDKLGIDYNVVRPYAQNETEKTFTKVDCCGFLNRLSKSIKVQKRTLQQKVEAQLTYLGYIDIKDSRYNKMGVVTSVNTKYSPRLTVYSLKNGSLFDCKIDKRTFNRNKLQEGDIISIKSSTTKPKMRKLDDGTFETIQDTLELWITNYHKLENL